MSSLDPVCSRVIMSMENNLPLSADIPDNGVCVWGGGVHIGPLLLVP